MAEEIKEATTEDETTSNAEVGSAKVEFTPEQNAKIEEIAKKREAGLAEKLTKEFESKLKQKELEKAKAEEMAKLTEQERFQVERKEFAFKEARFNALQKLNEEGLSSKFVDMVADTDSDKMLEKINGIKEYLAAEVDKRVDSTLKASPKGVVQTKPNQQNPLSTQEERMRKAMGL